MKQYNNELYISMMESALKRLTSGKGTRFICVNLMNEDISRNTPESGIARRELTEWIQSMMVVPDVFEPTYETWVKFHHPSIAATMTYEQIQEGRIQWVQAMIDYLQKGGEI